MPNKASYRVAVIGSTGRGNYGHGMDAVWAALPETHVVAVADDQADGLARAAGRLKVAAANAYRDYREMLAKEKPDRSTLRTKEGKFGEANCPSSTITMSPGSA